MSNVISTAHAARLEVRTEDGLAESALLLSIADYQAFDRLKRRECSEDAAVSPRILYLTIPLNAIE